MSSPDVSSPMHACEISVISRLAVPFARVEPLGLQRSARRAHRDSFELIARQTQHFTDITDPKSSPILTSLESGVTIFRSFILQSSQKHVTFSRFHQSLSRT